MKRRGFPFGMFFLTLALFLGLSAMVTAGYFYYSAKERIESTVAATRSYAFPLAESLAKLAELSHRLGDYTPLKAMFHEKIGENIIDEAFFVLPDGKLVAHSNKEVEKELQGNIAWDQFAYNTDLILAPLAEKSKEIRFIDYNIIEKKIPFRPLERKYLKMYLYNNIDTTGWLVTRAVFTPGKKGETPVGAVSFLVSKDRVFSIIMEYFKKAVLLGEVLGGASLFMALALSLMVFFRYRNYYPAVGAPAVNVKTGPRKGRGSGVWDVQESVAIDIEEWVDGNKVGVDTTRRFEAGIMQPAVMDETLVDIGKTVRDAIPVKKRISRV